MKIKLLLIFLYLCVFCLSLKTRSLETMRLARKSTEDGDFDIIKILNINDTDIDNQETRILRRKMKKSDLENFEGYLDSYLNILRKFNKRISQNKAKKLNNLTFEIMHKKSNKTVKQPIKMIFNVSNISNESVALRYNNETTNETHIKINNKIGNETKILNTSNITNKLEVPRGNSSINTNSKRKNNKSICDANIKKVNVTNSTITNNNYTNSSNVVLRKKVYTSPKENQIKVELKSLSNSTTNKPNNGSIIPKKISKRIISQLDEKNKEENQEFQRSEDKSYEKIKKKNEINEEFIQKQKELINSANNIFMNDSNDFNIYKKIINISLSLIVVGLLMGILLGLILVMYLNSRSSK